MIRCIIVDDEVLAQQVIQSHLLRMDSLKLMGIANNALEAADLLKNLEIDLIFLDIQLPGMTGLNFLRSLVNPPLVVLTTAYAEYALESYEFSVIDYLLKPISLERFTKAVNKITEGRLFTNTIGEKTNSLVEHIFIKSGSKYFKVNYSEVLYVQGMKDYLKIYTIEHRLVTHQTMSDMEAILPARLFMRVHKSYIIAISKIKSVFNNGIEIGDTTIPIGNSYRNRVMDFIERKET
jgi:DNA-binding LytR/AlgR family response regulator